MANTDSPKTFQRWLPVGRGDVSARLMKKLNLRVIAEENSPTTIVQWYTTRWPGTHRNVCAWALLEDGTLVGWNENPGVGWGFPTVKLIKQDLYTVRVGDQVIADNQNYASAEVFERQPGAEKTKNGRHAYLMFGRGLPKTGKTIAVTEAA